MYSTLPSTIISIGYIDPSYLGYIKDYLMRVGCREILPWSGDHADIGEKKRAISRRINCHSDYVPSDLHATS